MNAIFRDIKIKPTPDGPNPVRLYRLPKKYKALLHGILK